MDQKLLSYGRGGAVGSVLGHTLFEIFNGAGLYEIVTSAAEAAAVGICVVLLIEFSFRRTKPTQS